LRLPFVVSLRLVPKAMIAVTGMIITVMILDINPYLIDCLIPFAGETVATILGIL
jgi:hypothetical protein